MQLAKKPPSWITWGRLLRLPNLFTVPGDAAVGCFLGAGGVLTWPMALAGACLVLVYMGGLLFNDYFDWEVDARERPERPLPSGAVAPGAVLLAAVALTLAGVVLLPTVAMTLAGVVPGFFPGALPGLAMAGVAACSLAYNAGAKKNPWAGIPLLGLCRGGGVWAGACFAGAPGSPLALAAVGTVFLYTMVVSRVAAGEAKKQKYSPWLLALPGFWVLWVVAATLLQAGRAFPLWCIPVAAPVLGFLDTARAVQAVRAGRTGIPALVGRCLRAMLWGQLFWFLWAATAWGSVIAALVFIPARVAAGALGRRFYGS
ncbi:MAG: UbiA family prenyltransferase [Pseudomonadota bacterium]